MKNYSKQIVTLSLVFLMIVFIVLPVTAIEKPTIGLLKINNYSGIDTVGGNKLEKLVVDEFVANIQKQGSIQFISHEKIKELMIIIQSCTVADLVRN